MHTYGHWPNVLFRDVEEAASFIGDWLRKWGRISVCQTKEKYGTARVYCSLGWNNLHEVFYPGYMFLKWPRWIAKIDDYASYGLRLNRLLYAISYPLHKRLYRWRYKQAIKKYPHIKEEILYGADYPEELKGL